MLLKAYISFRMVPVLENCTVCKSIEEVGECTCTNKVAVFQDYTITKKCAHVIKNS